ncbi:MAG: TetR/AcrR family transcriptional regulator [Candidatus Hermodarchaeota archaeon]
MPKPSRSTQEIRKVKEKILDCALDIINQEGTDKLSMRKLASRMDMSAANLYNYYKSKENILAALDTNGFKILFRKIKSAINSMESPIDKIKALIREYINFGTDPLRVELYNIMLNRARVPDYKGIKGLEDFVEYQTRKAFKFLDLSHKFISDYININPKLRGRDSKILTLRIWIELHGIVAFYNNRLLNELQYSDAFKIFSEVPKKTVSQLTDDLIDSIVNGDL